MEQLEKNIINQKHESLSTAELKEKYWVEQNNLFEKIYKQGIQEYIKENPGTKKAFQLKDLCIHCIDERVPGGVHLAGSGTLLEEKDVLEYIKQSGATGITSHAECGAAKLAMKAKGFIDPTPEEIDQFAKEWAKQISEKAGIPYIGHIEVSPHNLHIARVAYYDGTGNFDFSQTDLLPPGFVISRRYLNRGYAKKEAAVAISIAVGDHGFGDKITPESPFIIVPIGDPSNPEFSLEKLQSEIEEIIKSDINKEIIKIDGFTAEPLTH